MTTMKNNLVDEVADTSATPSSKAQTPPDSCAGRTDGKDWTGADKNKPPAQQQLLEKISGGVRSPIEMKIFLDLHIQQPVIFSQFLLILTGKHLSSNSTTHPLP
jgi:hypothetical protein